MAELTTAQKADVIVTDEFGTAITGVSFSVSDPAILGQQTVGNVFQVWGQAEGTATISATKAGSLGQIEVSVIASPLGMALTNIRSKDAD